MSTAKTWGFKDLLTNLNTVRLISGLPHLWQWSWEAILSSKCWRPINFPHLGCGQWKEQECKVLPKKVWLSRLWLWNFPLDFFWVSLQITFGFKGNPHCSKLQNVDRSSRQFRGDICQLPAGQGGIHRENFGVLGWKSTMIRKSWQTHGATMLPECRIEIVWSKGSTKYNSFFLASN